MKNTFSLLAVYLVVSSLGCARSFADEGNSANFEKHKAEVVKEIDERTQKLQEHKTCISSAANHDALKACHSKMKEWRQSERAEHLEKRKAHLDERIQKLQEKKNGMKQ